MMKECYPGEFSFNNMLIVDYLLLYDRGGHGEVEQAHMEDVRHK